MSKMLALGCSQSVSCFLHAFGPQRRAFEFELGHLLARACQVTEMLAASRQTFFELAFQAQDRGFVNISIMSCA